MICYGRKNLVTKISQKAILRKDDAILMVLDPEGLWELPGGRLHQGEEARDGLLREVREELGLDVVVLNIYDVFVMQIKEERQKLVVIYTCDFDESQKIVPQRYEILDHKWVTKQDIVSLPMHPEYKRIFE